MLDCWEVEETHCGCLVAHQEEQPQWGVDALPQTGNGQGEEEIPCWLTENTETIANPRNQQQTDRVENQDVVRGTRKGKEEKHGWLEESPRLIKSFEWENILPELTYKEEVLRLTGTRYSQGLNLEGEEQKFSWRSNHPEALEHPEGEVQTYLITF